MTLVDILSNVFVPVAGILAVLFAVYLARDVLSRDQGTPEMQAVASTIFEGAMAFLRRQYTTIALLAAVTAVLIGILIALIPGSTLGLRIRRVGRLPDGQLGVMTSIAFLLGRVLLGHLRLHRHVHRRAGQPAHRLGRAPQPRRGADRRLRGGAVSGFLVVALSLLGVYADLSRSIGAHRRRHRHAGARS